MERLEYKQNEIIFRQGEVTHELFVVESGIINIYRNYGLDNERLLVTLDKGKSFAETAIVSDRPRSVTAVVAEDAVLRIYEQADFGQLQQDYPDMALEIIAELSQRLRNTTDRFMEACRTIAESMDEKELKNNKGLLARLKKFATMYDDACKVEYDREQGKDAYTAVSAYNNFGTGVNKR